MTDTVHKQIAIAA